MKRAKRIYVLLGVLAVVCVAAFAVVLLVTVATVTFCSWRTANENPADSVKSE